MARMHSRKKGKSGSKKPIKKTKPTWLRYTPKEVEVLIVKLAKEGNTTSTIGVHLRDNYGIPSAQLVTKKSITQILQEKKLIGDVPEDLIALIKSVLALKKHLEENKQDKTAKRGLQLTESKVRRLVKYYKKNGKLAADWKYDPDKIKLMIE
jgi:small subunit ribosomal protein S15